METNEIIANNKLIAEFMTGESRNCTVFMDLNRSSNDLDYNKSWDWLMPVVEKIENCFEGMVQFNISDENVLIEHSVQPTYSRSITTESKIKSIYLGVVKFIKWYNENK